MSKIFIIPDVHGRDFWKKAYEYVDKVDEVIFLGDYLDPYEFEHISEEQAIENFKEILQFKKEHRNVTLLWGNHDHHYIPPFNKVWGCRRIDSRLDELTELYTKNLHHFQVIRIIENYIFSHAGVLKDWFETVTDKKPIGKSLLFSEFVELSDTDKQLLNISLSENEINSWLSHEIGRRVLGMVSRERGGRDRYGSCLWADIYEHIPYFNTSQLNYYQIFSHSLSYPTIDDYYKDNYMAMLDCRKCFMLDTETHEINEVTETISENVS